MHSNAVPCIKALNQPYDNQQSIFSSVIHDTLNALDYVQQQQKYTNRTRGGCRKVKKGEGGGGGGVNLLSQTGGGLGMFPQKKIKN